MIILRQKNYSSLEDEMAKAFQKTSQILASLQPKEWKKVVMYAEITSNSYEICYYTKINNKFIKCYNLEGKDGLTRKQHQKVFDEIYKLLLPIQKRTKCYVMTLTLDNSGHMVFDLEYNNPFDEKDEEKAANNWMKFKKDWEKKYLN